jgi:hypothetical protein
MQDCAVERVVRVAAVVGGCELCPEGITARGWEEEATSDGPKRGRTTERDLKGGGKGRGDNKTKREQRWKEQRIVFANRFFSLFSLSLSPSFHVLFPLHYERERGRKNNGKKKRSNSLSKL